MLKQVLLCLVAFFAMTSGDDDASESAMKVSVDFLRAAMKGNTKNSVISPLSVSTLLSILQQGALGNTLTQLNEALHADAAQSRKLYGRLIRSLKLNFANSNAAAQEINSWVQKQTHGKVNELVTPDILGPDTCVMLANAVYFKGIWASPFNPEKTKDKPFTIAEGQDINVPTMHRKIFTRAGEVPSLGYKWIQLPFEGEQYSMYIVLPNKGVALRTTVEQLAKNEDAFTTIVKSKRRRNVELALPKFKLSTQMDLTKTLRSMGINDIFAKETANLKGISNKPLYVTQVLHQVNLSIDEKGGTGASSTGVVLQLRSAFDIPSAVLDFTVNRPFLVFIVDKVNISPPLFAGQVINPLKS
ncbi:Alpha-1-antitrypsin-like protein CM55-SI [Blattella germanica]|nr:Alpha-1-antitrypsin-like protein CM55-SI [Blattella germanica]